MKLIELSFSDFDAFAENHALRTYCQSSSYARFMGERGFSYDYVGFIDDEDKIIAASLILYKRIGSLKKYAYAPKGFLIDYYDVKLVKAFTEEVSKRYKTKGCILIKINPEIIIGELKSKKHYAPEYNENVKIIDDLKDLNYKRRRELVPYELIMPRITPIINLKKYDEAKLGTDFASALKISRNNGLIFEVASSKDIASLYDIVGDIMPQEINYYRNLLNIYSKTESADLLLVKIDYREFLVRAKAHYDVELENNNLCNERMQSNPSDENLNLKMESDRHLLQLKNSIVEATEGLRKKEAQYVAGAVVIKHLNRATIISSGYDKNFSHLNPMHFLYSSLIDMYKVKYEYFDLNGLAVDSNNALINNDDNYFKLGFKPIVYEYVGEFDIILDERNFKMLQAGGFMSREVRFQRTIGEESA